MAKTRLARDRTTNSINIFKKQHFRFYGKIMKMNSAEKISQKWWQHLAASLHYIPWLAYVATYMLFERLNVISSQTVIFFGVVLGIWFLFGAYFSSKSDFVRHHFKQAINSLLTVFIVVGSSLAIFGYQSPIYIFKGVSLPDF
jgi:hypothetical protein